MSWQKSWHQGLVKTLLSLIYRTQKHSAIIYFRTLLTEAKANRLLLLLVIFFFVFFFWRYLLASTTSHRNHFDLAESDNAASRDYVILSIKNDSYINKGYAI